MQNRIGSKQLDQGRTRRMWRPAAVVAGIAWAVCPANAATAESELNRASTIACSSDNGQRQYCEADTQRGVRLIRPTRGFGCRPANWGYDARGVWVDGGCQAEFDLSGEAGDRRNGAVRQTRTIGVGTNIPVRNNEAIDIPKSGGQAFSGVVYQDVLDEKGDVAIPKGSYANLIVKSASDEYLTLNLESVEVNGVRYPVTAVPNPTDGNEKGGLETAARNGGVVDGAKLVHAIAQVHTRGRAAQIRAESFLTFRLARSLEMGGGGR